VGLLLISAGACSLSKANETTLPVLMFAATALASGLLLLIGFFTPIGGTLGALSGVCAALFAVPIGALNPAQLTVSAVVVVVMAAAVGILGPGAFSIDSRLFGRRKIVIP
jgi:uncharacterized membrane protein YphA (DoxX/SURF4 family)